MRDVLLMKTYHDREELLRDTYLPSYETPLYNTKARMNARYHHRIVSLCFVFGRLLLPASLWHTPHTLCASLE